MEVKQKVAREVARKQAARAAIALGKEELSSVRSVPPSQGMVGFSVDLPLGDTLAEKQEQGVRGSIAGKPGYRYRSPVSSHLRKISKEAHRTWQRGTQVWEHTAINLTNNHVAGLVATTSVGVQVCVCVVFPASATSALRNTGWVLGSEGSTPQTLPVALALAVLVCRGVCVCVVFPASATSAL